ncbi:hypothetical protein D3C72_2525450 [compost metagenome]
MAPARSIAFTISVADAAASVADTAAMSVADSASLYTRNAETSPRYRLSPA